MGLVGSLVFAAWFDAPRGLRRRPWEAILEFQVLLREALAQHAGRDEGPRVDFALLPGLIQDPKPM